MYFRAKSIPRTSGTQPNTSLLLRRPSTSPANLLHRGRQQILQLDLYRGCRMWHLSSSVPVTRYQIVMQRRYNIEPIVRNWVNVELRVIINQALDWTSEQAREHGRRRRGDGGTLPRSVIMGERHLKNNEFWRKFSEHMPKFSDFPKFRNKKSIRNRF